MGVIKRNENLFEIKCTASEETLYIPTSDDDDGNSQPENNVELPQHPKTFRQRLPTIGPSFTSLKNYTGKKKFRRFNNVNQLMTLMEEDELQEVTIEDFIEGSKSGFAVLLEDEISRQKWNEFISSSEEHQKELLEQDNKKKHYTHQPIINRTLRNLLRKRNLPLGMLDYLEQQLISFFSAEPTKTYISPALSSFERLLLHSLSNYHHLASLSFVSKAQNVKLVQVRNPKKEFPLPPLLLVQYIKSKYMNH